MFTQCPSCESLFQANAQNLRVAMGMVRCTHCATVFNALAALKDEHEVEPAQAEKVGEQLPTRDFGDAVVIDVGYLAKHHVYRDALESTRPPIAADTPDRPLPSSKPAPVVAQLPSQRIAELAAAPSPDAMPETPEEAAAQDIAHRTSAFSEFLHTLLGQTTSLAIRNLSRHRRRTALAMGAIGFGIAALILAGGFAEWMMWAEGESAIHSRLGHIQIVKRGFYEKGVADPHAYLIADNAINTQGLASLAHVKTVGSRLNFSGLVSKEDTTISFLGEGVTPDTDADLAKEIYVHAGQALSTDDPTGILLGKGLAASIGAEVDDTLVLLTNDKDGKISAVDARVRGIFHTAVKAYDDVALRAPIALSRKLLKTTGSHQLLILLDKTEYTPEVLEVLRGLIPAKTTNLQLVPWIDLAEFYKAVVDLFAAQTRFVNGIIAIIIIMSISNTLVMSVMERTSEIGTLMAVGYPGRRIMRLFVTEGFIIGLLGGLAGTVVGLGIAALISHIGIPMPPAPGMSEGFMAYIRVTAKIAWSGFLIAVISAVIASLYPAWKASRLEIVDALRRAR